MKYFLFKKDELNHDTFFVKKLASADEASKECVTCLDSSDRYPFGYIVSLVKEVTSELPENWEQLNAADREKFINKNFKIRNMKFINLTPHNVVLNDGTVYPKSGAVAGIEEAVGEMKNGIRQDTLGGVTNLPKQSEGITYIVSMPTLLGLRSMGDNRNDVVCPITRGEGVKKHPEKGFIVSVPGLRTF